MLRLRNSQNKLKIVLTVDKVSRIECTPEQSHIEVDGLVKRFMNH